MTTAANGNGRQPDDPGAAPGKNGKGRKLWIEPKISVGNILTVLTLIVLGAIAYAELNAQVKTNSKRIAALSAADTRRASQIADKIVTAISELRTAVQVLSANSNRFEAEVRRELDELRRDVRLQRGREGP